MTHRSRTPAFNRPARRGGILKKLLLGSVATVLLLVIAVAVLVPMLAGNLLIPRIEAASSDSIEGSVRIDSLSVSWTGEQSARSVELLDPNGDVVGQADLTVRRSLFGLLSSPRNLGTVALSGWIEIERANESAPTNLERAIKPKQPAPTPPPTQQPGAEPITLPPLRMTLDVSDLRFSYELAGKKIGISKLAIKGPLTLDGQTNLTINAVPTIGGNETAGRTITASVKSGPLLNSSRELTIAGSGLELTVDANLPGEYTSIISGLLGEPVATAGASSDSIRLRTNIREQSGRLVASGSADALSLEGPLPPALIARLAPAGTLRITQPGAFTLRTTRFDLPVALITAGLDSTDLRDSALLLALETQPVGATLTTDGLPPKSLRIEPIDLRFGSENFAQRAFVQGDIRALIDDTPAGTVLLDARVDNLLGPGGTLAAIAQVRPAGQIRLVDAPASLVDSFTAGIDALGTGFARDVFGETINLTLDAESRADLGSDDTALESPKLALSIDSANTTVRATAILDGDRIEAPGEALSIQSSAGRGILTRFAPQVLAEMDAESAAQRPIALTVSATDLTLIQGTDTPIDLDRLRANLRASIDRQSASARGLDRIVLAIDAAAGTPLDINAIATGNRNAGAQNPGPQPYNITADLQLAGLSALASAANPLRARGVRTDGTITVIGAPVQSIEQLTGLDPQTLTEALGDRLDGTITLASATDANIATLDFETPTTSLDAEFRLAGTVLTSTRPLSIASREPQRLLDGFDLRAITINDQTAIRIAGPADFRATVEDIELDLDRLDGVNTIVSGIGSASINAPGLELVGPDGQRETYTTLSATLITEDDTLHAQITGQTNIQATLSAAASLPLNQLLDSPDPIALAGAAQRTLTASITAPAWLAGALAPEQAPTINAALAGEPVSITIEPIGEASGITVRSGETVILTQATLRPDAVALDETNGRIRATPERLRNILAALSEDQAAPSYSLASPATLDLRVDPITIPMGEGASFDLAGLTASATLEGDAVVTGVLERDGAPRDIGIRAGSARIAFADAGPTIEASASAFDPSKPATPLGALTARIDPGARFDIRLNQARPRAIDAWLAGKPTTDGPLALTFGDSLNLRAQTRTVTGLPAGTDRIEIGVESPRMNTRLLANRSETRIALAEPFEVAWTLAPAMFDELIAPVIADTEGSQLRLREAAPAAVAIRSFSIDKRDGAFDPATARIDAQFGMINANFDAVLGEPGATQTVRPINLDRVQGAITRTAAESEEPIRFNLESLDQNNDPRFTVEGQLNTAASPGTNRLSATASGDIPTALIDVLAGQRGLLVAGIGDTVRVSAQADNVTADRTQGKLTATVQALRAEAAAFGRFENGALILGDGTASRTNVTLSEITPELSRRVFEPLFPLLRNFEKSRTEQPTMITVTSAGLSIPTDGDLTKLNGNINLNLGSVRFEAGDLLSAALNATANRTAGQLGQSVPPVLVRFNAGVATYDAVDIPFGDFTLRTRGTIDLVNRRMDVLVLLPLDFIGGDFKRAAQQFPLLNQLAAVPLRARGEIGKAKLELDPNAIEEIIPGALERNLNDLLNRGLQELFRR
ncbi:MAG: hypothetical protein NXI14_02205 [bacterium]|nr:hypothetical protein [bacterium]